MTSAERCLKKLVSEGEQSSEIVQSGPKYMLHTKSPRVALANVVGSLSDVKGGRNYGMRPGSVQHLEASSSTKILALNSDTIHETTLPRFVAYVVYIFINDSAL